MKKLLLLLAVIASVSACKTDFDTVAPYKEVMVVYGLLDTNQSIQYIRISKAYLGEGNALVMAQQSDSINYGNVLDVTMERTLNNVKTSYPLIRIDTIPKDEGTFSSFQIFYADTHKVQTNAQYKITIHNNSSGLIATGTTGIVKNVTRDDGSDGIESPTPNATLNFTGSTTQSISVKFRPGSLGKRYNVILRFYYQEKDISGVPYTVLKSFDWDLGEQNTSGGGELTSYLFIKHDFFPVVAANIVPDNNKLRLMQNSFHIIVTGVTEEVATYISLTNPSAGITQDRPFYTNIENGIGIFSSRNIKFTNYGLSQATVDSLKTNPNTAALNFRDSL
jgi:hypothetical protein